MKVLEKRRHPRYAYAATVKLCPASSAPERDFLGVSVNISDSGMCIYTSDCLPDGETLEIRDALPGQHRKAAVRWVKNISGDFYKLGLMFL